MALKLEPSRNTKCFCNIIYTNARKRETKHFWTLEFNLRNGLAKEWIYIIRPRLVATGIIISQGMLLLVFTLKMPGVSEIDLDKLNIV